MLFAAKWFDPVIGIDIHLIQPPGPVPPVPVPHPFIGIVFDPLGLAVGMAIGAAISGAFGGPFSGPVFINGMPAANTGTEVKGLPVHIPIGGVFVNPPKNEGTIITGSKTVYIMGSSAARLTSMVITCHDPINLPTSVVMAIPMGKPVFIGGPTSLDILAAVLAAIRTKWVSDKLHSLFKAKPGSWTSRIICFFTGHPVDVVSGRVVTYHADFQLPGAIPFSFERTYYSASTYNGPLGCGWHHAYDQHISIRNDAIFLRSEDGREIEFDFLEVGESLYEPVERLHLERQANTFVLRTADLRVLRYGPTRGPDGTFMLTRIEDLNNNAITLQYVGNRVVRMVDTRDREVQLKYDVQGRIVALQAPSPDTSTPITVARFEYDAAGDLVKTYDVYDHSYRYAYRNHLLIQETNRNGLTFYFEYNAYEPDGACVHTWGTGGIYERWITYEKSAHFTMVENSRGAKTVFFWNDAGLVTKITDALGGVTALEWDANLRKVMETDPNGITQQWAYDSHGNMTKAVDGLEKEIQYRHSALGLVTELIDRRGHAWKRFFDNRGNLLATEDPAGHRWGFQTDRKGRLIQVTNPALDSFRFEYDEQKNTIRETDWEGNITLTHADGWDRPVRVIHPTRIEVDLRYDLLNRVIGIELAGKLTAALYYDPEGNLLSVTRNGKTVKQYRYSGFNRLVERIDARGFRQQLRYDSEENLIEVVNEKSESCRIQYNLVNKAVEEQSFDGRRIKLEYDPGWRRTKYAEDSGSTLQYFYDAGNRIIKKAWSDGVTDEFKYDPEGEVVFASNGRHVIDFERDAWGRVVRETRDGRTIGSVYNPSGLRVRRRDPWEAETTFTYDKNGNLQSLTPPKGRTVRFDRDPFGRETRRTFGSGMQLRSEYNPIGQLESRDIVGINMPVVASRWSFGYDENLEVTRMTSDRWGVCEYAYDSAGFLLEYRSQAERESYRYDQAGNRLDGAGPAPGNRLEQLGRFSFNYDKNGRIVRKREQLDGQVREWAFAYLASGQLKNAINPLGQTVEFEYDPFGRRVCKKVDGNETSFWWDEDELLGDESQGVKRQYWYDQGAMEDFMRMEPILFEGPTGLGHFLCDHAGTAREVFSDDGNLIWGAKLDPWGSVVDMRGIAGLNPLRFPGQYQDVEIGLHYNRFRYYDSDIGRYTTPDPAGLAGGLNEFTYGVNPVSWIDPFGLAPFEQSHSFSKYLLRGIQKAGAAFTQMTRIPGQTTVRLGRHVHRAFHEAFESLLPQAARHAGSEEIARLIRQGVLTPKQIADALETAAKRSLRQGSPELAQTLDEIKRLRKCGGF
jgi:RHS repeat-associated protein